MKFRAHFRRGNEAIAHTASVSSCAHFFFPLSFYCSERCNSGVARIAGFEGKSSCNCRVMSSLITETAPAVPSPPSPLPPSPPRGVFASLVSARRNENATKLHGDGSSLIYRYKWNASGIIPRLFTTRRAIMGGTRRDGAKLSPFALYRLRWRGAIIKSAVSERDRYTMGVRLSKPPPGITATSKGYGSFRLI